jgi:pimeloyl-ACP methyl ester carboxylesterase
MNSADRFEVSGTDGVRLSVQCEGDRSGRPILLVHGYPDTLAVWDVVAAQLRRHHHVIRYDSRGAGASAAPSHRTGYRLAALAGDARQVAAAVRPGERVHLVGHDWGSVTGWEAVSEPDARDWVASFTAVSGPHPAHAAAWAGALLRHPGSTQLRLLARQQIQSWYLFAFQLPLLPELTWRHVLGPRWERRLRRTEGTAPGGGHPAPTVTEDAVHGLGMYRANLLGRAGSFTARRSTVPVQLVVPLRDRYITPALAQSSLRCADRAWRRTLDTGHWGALITHGETLAGWIGDFADHIDGAAASPDLAAAVVKG